MAVPLRLCMLPATWTALLLQLIMVTNPLDTTGKANTALWPAFIGHGVRGSPINSSNTVYPKSLYDSASGGPWPSHDTASSAPVNVAARDARSDSSHRGHFRFNSEASVAATDLPPRQLPSSQNHTAVGVDASGYFPRQMDVYQSPRQQSQLWSDHSQMSHSQQIKHGPVDPSNSNSNSFGMPTGTSQQTHNNMWNSRLFDFKADTSNADDSPNSGRGSQWSPNNASTGRLSENFSLPMVTNSADVQNYLSRKQSFSSAMPAMPSTVRMKPSAGNTAPGWDTRVRQEDTSNCCSITQPEIAPAESLRPQLLNNKGTRDQLPNAATSKGAD
ncbi:hypothetical protein F503_00986 [Ophiostoma piceae UAMH 11346]|uniref:Uncharacterized protein n=1 Tax=Ophiostoma piceae (strain UAMH 11346) TaxID=1262450 RepID=S3CNV6_OPHP1|nr:hypothetical protein F503_00986 [Ophiostoma piceae UAMH 11346]